VFHAKSLLTATTQQFEEVVRLKLLERTTRRVELTLETRQFRATGKKGAARFRRSRALGRAPQGATPAQESGSNESLLLRQYMPLHRGSAQRASPTSLAHFQRIGTRQGSLSP
jgi:DNA-binding transcriptional LysR family regulator